MHKIASRAHELLSQIIFLFQKIFYLVHIR